MIPLFYLPYAIFCIYLAYKNAGWSNPQEEWKIKHWLNGAAHIAVAVITGYFLGWWHTLGMLCMARLVFNLSMNLFRKLNPFYVSPNPKSKLDRFEKWLFKSNGFLPDLVYLIIIISILIWA